MVRLFGIEFTSEPFDKVVERVITGRSGLVVTANVDHLGTLIHDERFRCAYRSAGTRTIDGFPLLLLAYIAGQRGAERIPGSDLAAAVFNRLRPDIDRPIFVASDHNTADAARDSLLSRGFSNDQVAVQIPPFGFEQSHELTSELRDVIQSFRPTQVFFAVGAPKSEIWCSLNQDCFGEAAILCVGSGLNMAVGTLQRGPKWMGAVGLEWAWRLAQDPVRLAPRYYRNAILLPYLVLQAFKQRFRRER